MFQSHRQVALALASLAVWTGILYDDAALRAAEGLLSELRFERVEAERPELIDRGLEAPFAGRTGFAWAEQIFELAEAGLLRRARAGGADASEAPYLAPARELLEQRTSPAALARAAFLSGKNLIEVTQVAL